MHADVAGGDGPKPARGPSGWLAGRRFHIAAGAISVLGAAAVLRVMSGAQFVSDDLQNLAEARAKGLGFGLLVKPIGGVHFAPGHRLMDSLIVSSGYSWRLAMVITAIWFALAAFACTLLVSRISGSRAIGVGIGLLFATSVPWLRAASWWASGIHEIPAAAFLMLAALAALAWERSRSSRDLVLTGAAMAGAVLFFDKYMAMAVPVIALLVIANPPERSISVSGTWKRIVDCGRAIAVLLGVCAIDVVASVVTAQSTGEISKGVSEAASAGDWLSFIGRWLTDGVGATAINANPATNRGSLLGLVVLAALAALTIRGSRSALLWLLAITVIIANGLVVAAGRGVAYADSVLVFDPRYQDLTLLTLILLVPAAWRAAGSPRPSRIPAIAGVGVWLVILIGWAVEGERVARAWSNQGVGQYAMRLRESLGAITSRQGDVTVLDGAMPASLTVLTPFPFANVANGVAIYAPDVRVPFDSPTGTPVAIAANGRAAQLKVGVPLRVFSGPRRCVRSPGGDGPPGGSPFAVTAAVPAAARSNPRGFLVTVRLSGDTDHGRIAFFASGLPTPFQLRELASHPEGLRVLAPPGTDRIRVALLDGASGCVESVSVQPISG